MQRINFKFLLTLIVAVVVTLGGLFLVRRFQVARNAGTKLEIARQRLEEGKLAQAMELFAQYVALKPDDDEAFAEYSKLLLGRATAPDATRNDLARAFSALETAVRRNPEDDTLRQQLAEFQLRVGRATDAREHLEVLERRLAGRPAADDEGGDAADDESTPVQQVQLLKAGSYLGSNEFEEAAAVVAKLVGYDLASRQFAADFADTGVPSDAYIMLAGILQERMAAPADARRVLEQLVATRGDDFRSWIALATWHRERGDLDDAARCVAKAIELAPENADCVFAEFEMALAARNWTQARASVERALELFPDEERTYRGVAAVAMQTGELARAEQVLLDGVERIPGRASLLLMLTDVLIQQGKLKEAAETIARVRELYGSNSPAVGLLEARMLVAESRWTEAKSKLEQVRPLVLGNPDLIRQVDLYLGQCHAQLNEFDAQLEVNRRILSADPGSLAARVGAAQALVSAGQTDQALGEFEAIAAAISAEQLVTLPQIWYPLLQLRIAKQAASPRAERDWSGVDSLLRALEEAGAVSASQLALLRAESLVRRGESQAARDLLSGLATAAAEPQIWAALATLALRDDGPDEALAVLDRAPGEIRDSLPLLTVEAQAVARRPRETARAALAAIEKRAGALPSAEAARMLDILAPLRLAMNDAEGAERLWREAAEKRPDDLQSREAILELAIATQNLDKARAAAAEIVRIAGPASARSRVAEASVIVLEAREELAKAATETGRRQELPATVRSLLDRARSNLLEAEAERPNWTQIQVLAADVDTLRGDPAGAIGRLKRAVSSGPVNPAVVRRLVGLLYAANRLEEAQQAMALLGEDGTVGLERISAEAELQAGKLDEAVALAEQSVAGDTQNHEDLLWLGQLLARSGKLERADEVLQRAAEIAPEEPEVWLALFTHRVASAPGTAEQALVKAAALLPEPRRQLALAQGYGMLGRTADSERLLREALAGWPDDLEAIRSLAAFEMQKGRTAEARTLLDRILALPDDEAGPSKPWARRMVAELTADQGTYRQLGEALKILRQNRGRDGKAAIEDLTLEITLLANRPEPASWRRAVELLAELETLQPLTGGQRLIRTQLRERLGLWTEARDELVALVAKQDTPPAYVAMLVEKLIDHGELSTAKTWLRRLQQASPESAITLALEAKLALAGNDRPAAIERARQLMPGGIVGADNPAQLAAVGRLMEDLGFPKAANRVFEQYAAAGGVNGVLARIEFLGRQGRGPEALDLLEAQWDALSLERALSTAVEVVRLQQDDVAARAVADRVRVRIQRAKREDPGSLVIRLLEAELASLEGRESEAEQIYRGLLAGRELDPGQRAIVANNLAFQLAEPKSAAEARKLIDEAVEELGPLPDLLDTRGLVRLAQGDAPGAVADLREAVLAPSAAKYLHLAAAELDAGDERAARAALERGRKEGLDRGGLPPNDRRRLRAVEAALGGAAPAAAEPAAVSRGE